MQILVHIPILERILGSLVCGSDTCVQMLQMLREANAHLEGIHGPMALGNLSVAAVGDRYTGVLGYRGLIVCREFEGIAREGLLRSRVARLVGDAHSDWGSLVWPNDFWMWGGR